MWFATVLLALVAQWFIAAPALAQAGNAAWPVRVQAVRSDWNAQMPPDNGWVDVTLPDDWSRRWPQFDGVVWYRLTWDAPAPPADVGLFIDYLTMAGAVRVNGHRIARDASLVEPLSRMWNTPRYFLLPAALLRQGPNMLLVRVSGLAAYQPGLGPVHIGEPAQARALFEYQYLLRHDGQLFGIAVVVSLGLLFLVLWLMRRQEVAYGWFAVQQFAWLVVAWNQIATTTWPFTATDPFEAANTTALVIFCACYFMFVLRFCERRWPRREAAVWIAVVLISVWMMLAPHAVIGARRAQLTLLASASYALVDIMFVYFAWRGGRLDQRILSLTGVVNLIAGTHDTLVFVGVVHSNMYYSTPSLMVTVVGVALVLAWNFVRNLRRIESFNLELQHSVEDARSELATSMLRQHELELVHARLGERVNLAHDLHDGLGGMLIGNIAALEQASESMPPGEVLSMLKELRDDLRLIIDTASAQHYGEHSLDALLAPLRHRMTRLFEAHGIDTRWRIGNLQHVYLTTTQNLDLLRILQEALANVLKHSKASRVEVDLHDENQTLLLEVTDNGVGLKTADQSGFGTGMRSMQARARRLGATFSVGSEAGATLVRLRMPRTVAKSA